MDIKELHAAMDEITQSLRVRGLKGNAHCFVNWLGEEVRVGIDAREGPDIEKDWHASKNFVGSPDDIDSLVEQARAWAAQLPDADDRAAELMARKLNEMAGKLPDGNTDIARAAWAEIHRMLISKAERIARNGLPSPSRISELPQRSA